MKIETIRNKNIWEDFLLGCEDKTFLNSWNWGNFQLSLGNKIWRLGILEKDKLQGIVLVVKIEAKRGKFLFIAHGPNLKVKEEKNKQECLKVLMSQLIKIGKEEGVDFIRIGPICERNPANQEIFKTLGFKKAPIHIHPEVTWELDISRPEDEILANMRKTTRYLIRKSEQEKEFVIKENNTIEGVEYFYKIYLETKKRQEFVAFPLEYIKKEFLAFNSENQISILLGEYQKEIISGGIFIFWQNICFYHHGASSKKYQKNPTSYLLLWQAIKRAKERGCKKFNFWGIAETECKNHPWAGLTLFKKGFGGEKKEYLKTQDYPFSFKYWLNFLIEMIRKAKRGY